MQGPAGAVERVVSASAVTSTPSRQSWGQSVSQVLKTCLVRLATMSRSLEGPVPLRIRVRSIMTVTYLSPWLVWRRMRSSTPIVFTGSKRRGSALKRRRPSAETAGFQATARPSAIRATVRCCRTRPSNERG